MPNPDYALWRAELKTPTPDTDRLNRSTDPFKMVGFWMIDGARTKPAWPVSIWANDDKETAFFQIGMSLQNTAEHADKFAEFIGSSWLKCIAVTQADWNTAIATGRWPDGRPARHFTDAERLDLVPDTPAAEGGNNPVGEDGELVDLFHEQVTTKITAQMEKVKEIKWPFKSLESANEAAGIVETLRALGKQGEARRKQEVAPFDEGRAKVQAKWVPFLEPASDMIKTLIIAIQSFKDAEEARLRREQQERERTERERLRLEAEQRAHDDAEKEAREALARGESYEEPIAEEIAEKAEAEADQQMAAAPLAPPPTVRVGTAHGRGVSKSKRKVGIITDKAAFIAAIADQQDFNEFLQTKADRLARANTALNGMQIGEE